MTPFELGYICVQPFLMPLHQQVRRRLMRLVRTRGVATILDVGGRKSHYTVGLRAAITISDVPRETAIQSKLNLGMTDEIIEQMRSRRSNVEDIIIDDMTRSRLPAAAFDCVVAVEVLEHVEEDARFLEEVSRVLKPGGVFLMTTPNGDAVGNSNPDHKRHYRRAELQRLLAARFASVEVEYAIAAGRYRTLGLRPWRPDRMVYTAGGMMGNFINSIQSAQSHVKHHVRGTRHLMATALNPL